MAFSFFTFPHVHRSTSSLNGTAFFFFQGTDLFFFWKEKQKSIEIFRLLFSAKSSTCASTVLHFKGEQTTNELHLWNVFFFRDIFIVAIYANEVTARKKKWVCRLMTHEIIRREKIGRFITKLIIITAEPLIRIYFHVHVDQKKGVKKKITIVGLSCDIWSIKGGGGKQISLSRWLG